MSNARKLPSGRKMLAAAIASLLVPTSASAAVGRIDFAHGDVSGVDAQGKQRRLTGGAPVNEGDTIVTRRGRAQIRFTDGARTSLLPESEFRVDRYSYEAQKAEESTGFFSLLKGGLRTITGAIGRTRRDGYRVTTPTATIGIRGTEYLAVLGNSLSVWVGDGEIEACNQAGCTLFESGESGYVANQNTKPIHTEQKPDTSSGEVGNDPYSAPEDVTGDGTPDVTDPPEDPPVVETPVVDPPVVDPPVVETPVDPPVDPPDEPMFVNGAFYVLAVALGDGVEGAGTRTGLYGTAAPDDLVNGTFTEGALVSYSNSEGNGSIGTAMVMQAGGDGIVGWGRWTGGTVTVVDDATEFSASPLLEGSESHHYAVGLPTMDMPTSGTASYTLIGGTSPTEASSSGLTGTLNSASLNVDFGTSALEADVDFTMGADNYVIESGVILMNGDNRFRFQKSGFFTSSVNCSGSCSTRIEGFFAGEAASRAGLTYLVTPDFAHPIVGAAAFTRAGEGTEIPQ